MSIEINPSQRVNSGPAQRRNDRRKAGSKPVQTRGASVLRSLKRFLRQAFKVVKNDVKEAKKIWLPWPVVLSLMVFFELCYVLLKHYGFVRLYLPILNSVGVFGFLFYLKWRLRGHSWFWITMAVVVTLHVLLILAVPWTNKWVPAMVSASVDSLDICIVFWTLAIIEQLSGGPRDNETEV